MNFTWSKIQTSSERLLKPTSLSPTFIMTAYKVSRHQIFTQIQYPTTVQLRVKIFRQHPKNKMVVHRVSTMK
ncbi:hypothetical protein EUGRSUZ_D00195 [Eucalyptus grandis]|uniref:Uncharacterized protein n=2 Tax=Eucalyptus grandis TaxID=71139 RepID=A0ACC3L214_EUCGR|nr:hypothetical protein EUGRSUZ_D00195 [Eucalyptus grandis]